MEELLNASLGSKIETVLRYAAPKRKRRLDETRLLCRIRHAGIWPTIVDCLQIFDGEELFYLFILNHLYRAVGMKDKCDYYDLEYQEGWSKFFHSSAGRDAFCEADPELGHLDSLWKA